MAEGTRTDLFDPIQLGACRLANRIVMAPMTRSQSPNGVPGPVVHPSSQTIPGDKVAIKVKWETAAGLVEHSAENLIYNNQTRSVVDRGSWVYNGSLIMFDRFLAQADGSIVSLVTDPVALVNNTGPGHDNDLIWAPNTNNLPPPGLPVEVTMTLEEKPK